MSDQVHAAETVAEIAEPPQVMIGDTMAEPPAKVVIGYKFAHYDPTITDRPSPVLGWYAGHEIAYPDPPPENERFHMNDDQWDNRLNGLWAVSDGILIPTEYVPTDEQLTAVILSKRMVALSSSDWSMLPDSPLTDEKKSEWVTYRKALRDITKEPGFPRVDLPPAPEK